MREAHKLSKCWLFKFQVLEVSVLSKSLIFVKRGVWLVFHQAGSSQNEQSLSLQEKTSESTSLGKYSNTLVQKLCSFKFFSILEENCDANIIIGTFNCETFVSYKSQVFSIFSEFEHHFEEISLFVKSTILGKSIFEGLDGVEMWWGKKFIY